MAATELATGYVSLVVSTQGMGRQIAKGFQGADREADKAGKRSGKRFGGGFGSLAKAGIAGGIAAAGIAAVQGLSSAIAEAREAEKVGKTTAQIIKATGGAAKVSAKDVDTLATAISNKSGMDDEVIAKGANLLLTFKNVRNEAGNGAKIFDRATQAAADLSAAGFGSVESSSKMLGKALNDPVKGITALQRAGVTFTDKQKEMIKKMVETGDTLGAQKLIMKEVESQVGGVAAASATAGEKFKVAFGNFKEQVGTALLPLLDRFFNFMTTKGLPALTKFGSFLSSKIGPALKTVAAGVSAFFSAFKTGKTEDEGTRLEGIALALRKLGDSGGFIRSSLIPAFQGVMNAARGLASVVLPIIKQIVAEFIKSWPQIKAVVVPIFKTVGQIVTTVMGIVGQAVKIGTHLIRTLWEKNGAGIIKNVKGVFSGLAKIIGGALKVVLGIVQVFHGLLTGDFKKASAGMKTITTGLKSILVGIWRVIKSTVVALVATLVKELIAKFKQFASWIAGGFKSAMAKITDIILAPIRNARDKLKPIFDQMAARFKSAVTAIGKAWDGLKAKAAAPIRFIINTVINGGLIKAFNAIASKVAPNSVLKPVPSFATGGILPGYTPGRDVHDFYSATGGRLRLSGGEPVMRPEFGRAVGKDWVDKANAIARTRGAEGVRDWMSGPKKFARGGIIGSFAPGGILPKITETNKVIGNFLVSTITKLVPMGATLKAALDKISMAGAGNTSFGQLAKGMATKAKDALFQKGKDWVEKVVTTVKKKLTGQGDPGGPAGTGSRSRVSWKGGTFTERFRNTLIRAQQIAGRSIPVTQGGFRPRTSYSGTSHAGDAIDTLWNSAILRGLRGARVAAWHRSPSQGPWGHHIHGIPLPGAGYPGGSGVWQAQDYLRGGNGLARGGFVRLQSFDQGGYLRPGLTLAHNGTGRSERVSHESGGVNFHGPVTVADPDALIRKIEAARRRREALQPVMA